jgi:hypothetical protein
MCPDTYIVKSGGNGKYFGAQYGLFAWEQVRKIKDPIHMVAVHLEVFAQFFAVTIKNLFYF